MANDGYMCGHVTYVTLSFFVLGFILKGDAEGNRLFFFKRRGVSAPGRAWLWGRDPFLHMFLPEKHGFTPFFEPLLTIVGPLLSINNL